MAFISKKKNYYAVQGCATYDYSKVALLYNIIDSISISSIVLVLVLVLVALIALIVLVLVVELVLVLVAQCIALLLL